uniref:retropepsin-like aspartic protease family protein n=2 Tax=Yoonia sp. TaxID=2212373 RepID=UPI004047C8C9|tara:strand:+ start:1728 stop:2306 length:579 start_codon:yes stop_codon:yes gene_type:complete
MSPDQTANLIYLSVLGGALLLSYLLASRMNLGKTLQQAGIWVLIFMGAIAVIGMWSDIQNTLMPKQAMIGENTIVLPRERDGHYYLTLDVNGVPVNFVVDTGATQVVLTQQDAARIGIDVGALAYLGSANTANGTVRTAAVRLDTVSLGTMRDTRVRAVVNDGQMDGSLLGMTYLSRFDSITIKDNQLILTR